jgi:hypothetical protein
MSNRNKNLPAAQQNLGDWLTVAQSVTFLHNGKTPSAEKVIWLSLLDAVPEIQELNAAIHAGKIDVLNTNGRLLKNAEKAKMEIRIRPVVTFAGIGVRMDVFDAHGQKQQRGTEGLRLRAEHIRALRHRAQPSTPNPGPNPRGAGRKAKFSWHIIDIEIDRRLENFDSNNGNKSRLAGELETWCWDKWSEKNSPQFETLRARIRKRVTLKSAGRN